MRDRMIDMVKTAVTCEDLNILSRLKEAGADEVILALEDGVFSALKTFAADEIINASKAVHEQGMQVSVLMNRLFPQSEVTSFQNQMLWLLEEGIDRIIIADPGLLQKASEKGCLDRLIYDPGTLMTNVHDVRFYHDLGLSSVSISQLLTAEEIETIAHEVADCSLAVFGHQMMSVSARPLLSAYGIQTGITDLKNRRNLYMREEKREEKMPAWENEYAAMIYSDYIQDSLDRLVSFAGAGIARFVFDGVFLPEEICIDALTAAKAVLNGREEAKNEFREKYSGMPLTDGYYGIKTIK